MVKLCKYTHDSWAYFALRYNNMTVIGAVQPSGFQSHPLILKKKLIDQIKMKRRPHYLRPAFLFKQNCRSNSKESNVSIVETLRDDSLP